MPKRKRENNRTMGRPTKLTRSKKMLRDSSPLPFKYDALDDTTDSIRVFEIIPGRDDSMIRCRMRNTTISNSDYTCLSYTWQPVDPRHDIEINGKRTDVGDNLYQFLHAARAAKITEPLWVDAVCINQSSIKERNHQVRQMGKIYKMANDVFVWFGVLDSSIVELLQNMDQFTDVYERLTLQRRYNQLERHVKGSIGRNDLEERLHQFVSLPYWNRMWIAQEIIPPDQLSTLIGTKRVSLHILMMVMFDLVTIRSRDSDGYDSWFQYPGFQYMWRRFILFDTDAIEKLFSSPLLLLVLEFQKCGCTHRRDHIYALLALAEDGYKFQVDYDVEHTLLFQQVMTISMADMELDQLLMLGASVIEVLGLRSTFPDSETGRAENDDDSPETLNIGEIPSTGVASPIWGKTRLELDNASVYSCQEVRTCMYVPIGDAGDVHIFEYIVEKIESEVIVNYARAWEYVQGKPRMYEENLHSKDVEHYVWLDMVSEDVHYFSGPNVCLPALRSWSKPAYVEYSQDILVDSVLNPSATSSPEDLLVTMDHQKPQLLPARRYWNSKTIRYGTVIEEARCFKDVEGKALAEVQDQIEYNNGFKRTSRFKLEPAIPRSTTFFFRIWPELPSRSAHGESSLSPSESSGWETISSHSESSDSGSFTSP